MVNKEEENFEKKLFLVDVIEKFADEAGDRTAFWYIHPDGTELKLSYR